jgi:hypothetical protein
MHSRNFKTPKIKNMRRHQKQINELRGALSKYQCEAENIINREINEIKDENKKY